MPISIKCPSCGKGYQAPDALAGKRVKCKQCGAAILFSAPTAAITDEPVETYRLAGTTEAAACRKELPRKTGIGGSSRSASRASTVDAVREMRENVPRRRGKLASGLNVAFGDCLAAFGLALIAGGVFCATQGEWFSVGVLGVAAIATLIAASLIGHRSPPLVRAAQTGDLAQVKALVSAGAGIDDYGLGGRTALHAAIQNGHDDVSHYLMDLGAEIGPPVDQGNSTIHVAAKHGRCSIMRRILDADASFVEARNKAGETPLFIAARSGDANAVRMLIEYGADVTFSDDAGRTILHTAAEMDAADVIDALLDAGAAPKQTCGMMLERAFRFQHATTGNQPFFDVTALHVAAWHGNTAVCRKLLARNSDSINSRAFMPCAFNLSRDIAAKHGDKAPPAELVASGFSYDMLGKWDGNLHTVPVKRVREMVGRDDSIKHYFYVTPRDLAIINGQKKAAAILGALGGVSTWALWL